MKLVTVLHGTSIAFVSCFALRQKRSVVVASIVSHGFASPWQLFAATVESVALTALSQAKSGSAANVINGIGCCRLLQVLPPATGAMPRNTSEFGQPVRSVSDAPFED